MPFYISRQKRGLDDGSVVVTNVDNGGFASHAAAEAAAGRRYPDDRWFIIEAPDPIWAVLRASTTPPAPPRTVDERQSSEDWEITSPAVQRR
jgi:hypothetical protein